MEACRTTWLRQERLPDTLLSDHLPSVASYMGRTFVTWNVANPEWDKWLVDGPLAPVAERSRDERIERIAAVVEKVVAADGFLMLQEVHPEFVKPILDAARRINRHYQHVMTPNCNPKDTTRDCGLTIFPISIGSYERLPNTVRGGTTPINYIAVLDFGSFILMNTHNKFCLTSKEYPLQRANDEVIEAVAQARSKYRVPVIIGGDWNADLPTVRAQMATIEGVARGDVSYSGTFEPSHFNTNDRALSLYDFILMIGGPAVPSKIDHVAPLEAELRRLVL